MPDTPPIDPDASPAPPEGAPAAEAPPTAADPGEAVAPPAVAPVADADADADGAMASTQAESTADAAPALEAPAGEEPAADVPDAAPAAVASAEAAAPPAPAVPELSPAACAQQLAERFPALFAAKPPKPLKLRIQADIQQRAPGVFTRKSLSIFLHRYTTGNAYLQALTRETGRYDLDGQAAGEVAAEHREAAAAELARRRALRDPRGGPRRDGRPNGDRKR